MTLYEPVEIRLLSQNDSHPSPVLRQAYGSAQVKCLVELSGIEPLTSSLRTRRSPN